MDGRGALASQVAKRVHAIGAEPGDRRIGRADLEIRALIAGHDTIGHADCTQGGQLKRSPLLGRGLQNHAPQTRGRAIWSDEAAGIWTGQRVSNRKSPSRRRRRKVLAFLAISKRNKALLLKLLIASLITSVVAVSAFSLVYSFRDIGFFRETIDAAMDQRMELHVDSGEPDEDARQIGLIDFDDRTLRIAGDPILISAPPIATVLHRLAEQRPWAVLLDLDITHFENGADLDKIRTALIRLTEARVPVLIVHDTILPSPGQTYLQWRPTAFDDLVRREPYLMWVGGRFDITERDGIVRRLAIIECVARAGAPAEPILVPSAALAVTLLERWQSLPAAQRGFSEAVRGKQICNGRDAAGRIALDLPRGARSVDLNDDNRLRFSMKQRFNNSTRPAIDLIREGTGYGDWFDDRLVIVGTTAAQRDVRQTPIGPMSGAAVHANAIRAWLDTGPEPGVRFWPAVIWVVLIAVGITLPVMSILLAVPKRRRPQVRDWAPPAMTALAWLIFYIFGGPANSIGAVIIVYVMTHLITIIERRLDSKPARQSEG